MSSSSMYYVVSEPDPFRGFGSETMHYGPYQHGQFAQ